MIFLCSERVDNLRRKTEIERRTKKVVRTYNILDILLATIEMNITRPRMREISHTLRSRRGGQLTHQTTMLARLWIPLQVKPDRCADHCQILQNVVLLHHRECTEPKFIRSLHRYCQSNELTSDTASKESSHFQDLVIHERTMNLRKTKNHESPTNTQRVTAEQHS